MAEPLPAVPPEAVTAAAQAIHAKVCSAYRDHNEARDLQQAVAALEAAEPIIRAAIYAEIRQLAIMSEAFYRGFCHQDTHCTHGGHIRSFADLIPGGETSGPE